MSGLSSSSSSSSISRSNTPIPSSGGSGNHRSSVSNKLPVAPTLRQTPSLSNLRVHSFNAGSTTTTTAAEGKPEVPPIPSIPQNLLENIRLGTSSSSSSVFNLDLGNGKMIVQDVETELDSGDEDIRRPSDNGESKQILRDQLRRTLSSSQNIASKPRPAAHWLPDSRKSFPNSKQFSSPRQYFILTDAGKPVFISGVDTSSDSSVSSLIGLMQALISVFIDDGDRLKSINTSKSRITFLQRSPLYYACVSSWGEPESISRMHLEYLHLQITSIVTSAQLRRIFERRGNFDLGRLLGGDAESFLGTIIERIQRDFAMSLSALKCMRLDQQLRNRCAQALVPTGKATKDILYVMLIAKGEIITLIRPKKHSVHPADIHIILTTLASPSLSNSIGDAASAMWVPLCLPKWNDGRMVNAYVVNLPIEGTTATTAIPITLVCIGGGNDFDSVRAWCDEAVEKLCSPSASFSSSSAGASLLSSSALTVTPNSSSSPSSILHHVQTHIFSHSSYTVSELGIPGLRHFVYKARGLVQVTFPVWEGVEDEDEIGKTRVHEEDIYEDEDGNGDGHVDEEEEGSNEKEETHDHDIEQRRILTLYQTVYDAIHAKSISGAGSGSAAAKGEGKEGLGLKLQYLRTEKEAVLGWITQPFEIYLTLSPLLPKSAAVGAANAVAKWVKKEEGRLFLRDAPVF